MSDAADATKNFPSGYVPPAVWSWQQPAAGAAGASSFNRPVSGATHDKALPVGTHPLQLYSQGTPNGQKVTIMLEELLAAGHTGAEYDAWLIRIDQGDQFGSGFVGLNPNSKIPALIDTSTTPHTRLFESGSILLYLAEKFAAFLPTGPAQRAATLNWLFWQVGAAPMVGGGFGAFFNAPVKIEYAINRYAMETKRQYHVLNTHLANNEYMTGSQYTIADMAIYPWYGAGLRSNPAAAQFLALNEYPHVMRWAEQIGNRAAVQRGRRVNTFRAGGPLAPLPERHSAADFD